MINYNNRKFIPVKVSSNGEVGPEIVFHYHQSKDVLTGTYSGGKIVAGQLIGKVDSLGQIDMRYQQLNIQGELMTGICHTKPEVMSNGKIRLIENWRWTSGDKSKGQSVLEEV
jgi:hypothetical protein